MLLARHPASSLALGTLLILLTWLLWAFFFPLQRRGDDSDLQAETEEPLEFQLFDRVKRDFMFASGQNVSDSKCFQKCNDVWRNRFEETFDMNTTDFYDFPFHPKILDYGGYLRYCELAEMQTKCFVDECGDETADRVFSPANFLCHFKRAAFLEARHCLEETEPLNFLKCDQQCHTRAMDKASPKKRAKIGKVFADNELDHYEYELDIVCTFQDCYQQCHRGVVADVCNATVAQQAVELVATYVQWHATNVYDWHLLSENMERLPASCGRLAGASSSGGGGDDVLVKLMESQ